MRSLKGTAERRPCCSGIQLPTESARSTTREREERGRRGGLPWSELPQGKQKMGQGCFCRRAGQLCKLSQGPPGLYKGGRGSSRGPRALPGTGGAAGNQQESGAKTQTQGRRTRGRAHTHFKMRKLRPREARVHMRAVRGVGHKGALRGSQAGWRQESGTAGPQGRGGPRSRSWPFLGQRFTWWETYFRDSWTLR